MKPVEPIFVTELFAQLHTELLALLGGLSDEDWYKPTAAPAWKVRDIAAHLLDSDIRRLSFQRDNAPQVPPDTPIENYRDLVGFLNQLNADWIKAARRISPRLLTDLLRLTGAQVADLFRSLDPFGPAIFSVAWAGEEVSANWFDIAREYTEKWHHQQQIRDAVGAPGLTGRRWLHPVLDTFLRGLPHTYRNAQSDDGVCIVFAISGEAGDEWTLQREGNAWQLYSGSAENPACHISLDQDSAWRLLTKGLSPSAAAARMVITGEQNLAAPFSGMLAVMA
ncbi:MAG: maleylpyruvate isomerase N-terminal domain-containing protein [Blastocatellia bacterium]